MPRTTLDIDAPILRDLKRLQKRERKSFGRLVSDLLTEALATHRAERAERPPFRWISQPMGARMNLSDKEAVWAALDQP